MEEIRLQKYIADCGIASRRKAEEMILQKRVAVNGEIVTQLGTKVGQDDVVTVDGQRIKPTSKKVYVLLNKPAGYLTTASDDFGRRTVMDLIKGEVHTRVFPVGRLDYDTEGLLLLTNDGDVAYAMSHPKHKIQKTYIVTLDKVPSQKAIDRLRRGVIIDGQRTLPARVDLIENNMLEISIREGRNRQIRKMAEAVGYEVVALKRISIGILKLGNIPLGRWRHLTKVELDYLRKLVDKK
ncbi:MAG: pseudouridine synthase [Eubacteriales bacterium]|jgi:23S rRNA pseudouridine2605 synthase|nr:pseudouridine synthase [Eubacteriales bacterium]